ncbi:MAG TPA: hypothetical protein PKD85_11230, partial [Saprospiraceae bacterium]|nr:hypothetical protein [Saprospiraceae bacterium]
MDFDEIVDLNFGGASLAQLKEGINSELSITNLEFDILDKNCKVTKANGHAIMKDGAIVMDSLQFNINDNDF